MQFGGVILIWNFPGGPVHTQALTETLPLTAIREPEINMKCHSSHEAVSTAGEKACFMGNCIVCT